MKASLLVSAALTLTLLAGCSTTRKAPEEPTAPPAPVATDDGVENIDVEGLSRHLGLTPQRDQLGYSERAFNTCEAGYGYSSSHRCRREFLAVLNFRLQCRDSEGTVSTASHQLTPIASDAVKWSSGSSNGQIQTDGEGYGQIRFIAGSSPKKARMRIAANGQFLVMRTEDIRRVVVPQNWCR